jgi:hypothetical protein
MLEPEIAGYWTEKYLDPGGMESADIAFSCDGTGWVYWSNAAGAFEVLRFSWHAPEVGQLTIRIYEYASGTWQLDGHEATHVTRGRARRDDHITVDFTITDGSDAVGNPAIVLNFGQPIIHGLTGKRFTLERQLADNERDPALRTQKKRTVMPHLGRRRIRR